MLPRWDAGEPPPEVVFQFRVMCAVFGIRKALVRHGDAAPLTSESGIRDVWVMIAHHIRNMEWYDQQGFVVADIHEHIVGTLAAAERRIIGAGWDVNMLADLAIIAWEDGIFDDLT